MSFRDVCHLPSRPADDFTLLNVHSQLTAQCFHLEIMHSFEISFTQPWRIMCIRYEQKQKVVWHWTVCCTFRSLDSHEGICYILWICFEFKVNPCSFGGINSNEKRKNRHWAHLHDNNNPITGKNQVNNLIWRVYMFFTWMWVALALHNLITAFIRWSIMLFTWPLE